MRQQVYRYHAQRPGYRIVTRSATYINDMATAKFCLAPTGGGHGKRQVRGAREGGHGKRLVRVGEEWGKRDRGGGEGEGGRGEGSSDRLEGQDNEPLHPPCRCWWPALATSGLTAAPLSPPTHMQVLVARFGCIPVPITDFVLQPFEPELDWRTFSVPVAEADVPTLHEKLAAISDVKLAQMQAGTVLGGGGIRRATLHGALAAISDTKLAQMQARGPPFAIKPRPASQSGGALSYTPLPCCPAFWPSSTHTPHIPMPPFTPTLTAAPLTHTPPSGGPSVRLQALVVELPVGRHLRGGRPI